MSANQTRARLNDTDAWVVREFQPSDVEGAAALLARRHRAYRKRFPELSDRFEQTEAHTQRLAGLATHGSGAVIQRAGQTVGFLLGFRTMHAPDSVLALSAPSHAIWAGIGSHAVAAGENPATAYHALYAHAAEQWVSAGFFQHIVSVAQGDQDVEDAWFNLGFGRREAFLIRNTAVVDASWPAGVTIRRATEDDIDTVFELIDIVLRAERESPAFIPYVIADVATAQRGSLRQTLANEQTPVFIAVKDGRPVGVNEVKPDPDDLGTLVPDRTVGLSGIATVEDARGSGIGSILLAYTLDWARESGHECCLLSVKTGNRRALAFYRRHGFIARAYDLSRHVDERTAWARPRSKRP